jgi:hypothetical protein
MPIRGAGSGNVFVDGVAYTLPLSFAWKAGSRHNVSAAPTIYLSSTSRAYFQGWYGSLNSSSPTISVIAKSNTQFSASYKLAYLVKMSFVDSQGRTLTPQAVILRASFGFVSVPNNQSAWLYAGKQYSVGNAVWMGLNVAPNSSLQSAFVVDRPKSVVVSLAVYDDVIRVSDLFGLPVKGAPVTLVTESGLYLQQATDANGYARFTSVPLGAYSASVSFLGVSTGFLDTSFRQHFTSVTVPLSYSSFGFFTTTLSVLAASQWGRRHLHRRIKAERMPFFRSRSPLRSLRQITLWVVKLLGASCWLPVRWCYRTIPRVSRRVDIMVQFLAKKARPSVVGVGTLVLLLIKRIRVRTGALVHSVSPRSPSIESPQPTEVATEKSPVQPLPVLAYSNRVAQLLELQTRFEKPGLQAPVQRPRIRITPPSVELSELRERFAKVQEALLNAN